MVLTRDPSKTHTIAQFRVQDFAMENCQIVINIPLRADLHKRIVSNKHFHLGSRQVGINVWRLDTRPDEPLDVRTLSLNTRPKRVDPSPMATLIIEEGVESASPIFHCPTGSLQTFELTCAEPKCAVDFWQDRVEPNLGERLVLSSRWK